MDETAWELAGVARLLGDSQIAEVGVSGTEAMKKFLASEPGYAGRA